jgi:cytochrome c-type biogenesis protein
MGMAAAHAGAASLCDGCTGADGEPAACAPVCPSTTALASSIAFHVAAPFMRRLTKALARLRRAGRVLHVAAALVLVAMGIAMMTGQLTAFSIWLLQTFPALGRIG